MTNLKAVETLHEKDTDRGAQRTSDFHKYSTVDHGVDVEQSVCASGLVCLLNLLCRSRSPRSWFSAYYRGSHRHLIRPPLFRCSCKTEQAAEHGACAQVCIRCNVAHKHTQRSQADDCSLYWIHLQAAHDALMSLQLAVCAQPTTDWSQSVGLSVEGTPMQWVSQRSNIMQTWLYIPLIRVFMLPMTPPVPPQKWHKEAHLLPPLPPPRFRNRRRRYGSVRNGLVMSLRAMIHFPGWWRLTPLARCELFPLVATFLVSFKGVEGQL